jgi:hypothetical protein
MVNPVTAVPISDNADAFPEVAYSYQSELDDFVAFKMKIVFTSASSVNVASVRNLRIIATS